LLTVFLGFMATKKKEKKVSIIPAPGYVLIKPLDAETKTASGIYLPDNASEKPQRGKVLAVGTSEILDNGKERQAPCKEGETVIYKKWGGNEVKLEQTEYLFSKFEDILAIEK